MWIDLEPDAWTMILDPTDSIFHTTPPKDSDEQIRFEVERHEGGPFFESMIFYVPQTRLDGFDLRLGWGTTVIPFEIEVESTFETMVAEADGRPLDGSYTVTFVPPEGLPAPPPGPFDVAWKDGHLTVASVVPGMDEAFDGWLLPRGAGLYQLSWVVDGELWEIIPDLTFEVVREGGRVVGFDGRSDDDKLQARVRRRTN